MGGVSLDVHNRLKLKSENQQREIDDLAKKNKELNIRYKERQEEIRRQEELRRKGEEELRKRKEEAFEYLENNLKIKQENETEKIEKEFVASISTLFHEDDEFENEINAYFLYKGSLAIITKWINNPNGYSTGELAESLTKITKKFLR